MSHHNPLRKDKTCLNCNYVVDNRYCGHCGQENIEPRKTFHHLFVHFFEDLTHYENAFWKTIKNLILKPASLTKEYLSGKRMSYLAPVRLYIFVSFVTFFFITLLSSNEEPTTALTHGKKTEVNENEKKQFLSFGDKPYKNVAALDSIQKHGKANEKLGAFDYWLNRKVLMVEEHNTMEELIEKFKESFIHNLPKVLFIYMPIFAFMLWLFHNKRKWYYFDHGIFTLHYFSFLLLMILMLFLIKQVLFVFGEHPVINVIYSGIEIVGIVWMVYYFFPAHHRFYDESRLSTIVKGSILYLLNSILILIILLLAALYTFINIH